MPFEVLSRHLGEVVVLAAKAHEDDRGYFLEAYREDQFRELGLPGIFVQDNHSCSKKGVVRGLHAQWDPPMGRLMKVTRGTAFLVAVDLRLGWNRGFSDKSETGLGACQFCAWILRAH
jgi:dTDP-4-dehydrorhamnose 3,5-epimerase